MRSFPVILAAIFACGCSVNRTNRPSPLPDIVRVEWTKDFTPEAKAAWERQLRLRWPTQKLVVVYSHGGGFDPWMVLPDGPRLAVPAEDLARVLRNQYPNRLVVLLCCNESHRMLHIKGVYYSPFMTWIFPGRVHRFRPATWAYEDGCGTAYQLVEGG